MLQKNTRARCSGAPPLFVAKAPKNAARNWPMQASTSSSSIRLMATRQGLSKGCAGSRKNTLKFRLSAATSTRRVPPRIWSKQADRKSVVEGKSVSGRVDPGGRRIIHKKKSNNNQSALKQKVQ